MPRFLELAAVALVAGSAGAWMSAPQESAKAQDAPKQTEPPAKLTARSIELVDAKGRVRSVWRVRDDGQSEMVFCGPQGERPRFAVECDANGPQVMWLDRDGNPRGAMVLEGDRFRLIAHGGPGSGWLEVDSPERGSPTIEMKDADKKPVWKAP